MKNLILGFFLFFSGIVVSSAHHCSDCNATNGINLISPEIILTSKNFQLLKLFYKDGTIRFTVKNLDGTVLVENISRLELKIDFPEIENKIES